MQQSSDTPSLTMFLIPGEILSKILVYTMRSDMPVDLDHFLRLGRRFQTRSGNDGEESETDSDSYEEPDASVCSERWFLDHLDSGQKEHFRDWLLINSTCRSFRAWGKKAFFSEKVFAVSLPMLKILRGETRKIISAENIAAAQACVRHVIAPLRNTSVTSQIMILPRYHALQRLRSMSIAFQPLNAKFDILSRFSYPKLKRKQLPEELSSLLRDLGLRVDQLEMELVYEIDERDHQIQMERLADEVYPVLRVLSSYMARARHRASVARE